MSKIPKHLGTCGRLPFPEKKNKRNMKFGEIHIHNQFRCYLRLDRGGGQRISVSCACFLIARPFLDIHTHTLHQIEADYHSYPMMSLIS